MTPLIKFCKDGTIQCMNKYLLIFNIQGDCIFVKYTSNFINVDIGKYWAIDFVEPGSTYSHQVMLVLILKAQSSYRWVATISRNRFLVLFLIMTVILGKIPRP